MVLIRGKWHTRACGCEYCATFSAEAGVQPVLGEKEGMITTKHLISRAVLEKNKRASERLRDGRIITAMVASVSVPRIKSHVRAFFYIDGKRITRATAAIILRNDMAESGN
jgi:hypothetical protein